MEWADATAWWVTTGVLVAVELTSGTFYLLMLAIGTAAGALAAHLGAPYPTQLVAAALVGGAAVVAWHLQRQRQLARRPVTGLAAMNLDTGAPVQVDSWDADGRARVRYRGSDWTARFAGPGAPEPGRHVIVSSEGSQLVLSRPAS
jgi:membrane protein implicated in regulation of membrane protease activity